MTPEEIIEGNKLIAEFMGLELEGFPLIADRQGKYHTSWDWLMPVVEKIESIGRTMVSIHLVLCEITPIIYDVKKDSMIFHDNIRKSGNSKIEAVWMAVVAFIKWFNAQYKS